MLPLHAFGMVGFVLVIAAYGLVSSGRLSATMSSYQMMNLVGALVLLIYAALFGAWVSVAINVVWGLIALNALRRLWRRQVERQHR